MPWKHHQPWLALAGLIPCLAAFSAATWPTTPPLAIPARSIPPLAFDQYGVSFGQIGPRPVVEAEFTFRNLGNRPLTIESVEPSCGCLRWHLQGDRRTYRPGEPGCITVRLATANEQPGPHHYSLTVHTSGDSPQTETLSFRVTLPERKVTIDPPEVYFYQLNGRPDTRTIHVVDHRENRSAPMRLIEAECRSRNITVEVGAAERDPQGGTRIPIHLTAAAVVPPGREISYLRLTTDDPEFPQLAVPVLIEGPAESSDTRVEYGPPPPESGLVDIWAILENRRNGEASAPP